MRVLYVAINYRTPEHVRGFVDCFRSPPDGTRVLIVDNTEPALRTPPNLSSDQAKWVACIPSPGNLGYFGGARFGLEKALADGCSPDWIVVSNVDVRLGPSEVHRSLRARQGRTSGVIAPSIVSTSTGAQLNPFMVNRPTVLRMHLYKVLFRSYWGYATYSTLSTLARRLKRSGDKESAPSADMQIYAPHGSLIIFSREFFDRGGSLAHPPFLYGEEITIGERARSLGLPVEFVPSIKVEHEEHASMSRLPGRAQHKFISEAATHVANTYFS